MTTEHALEPCPDCPICGALGSWETGLTASIGGKEFIYGSCSECSCQADYHDWNTRPQAVLPEHAELVTDIDDTVAQLCKLNEKMTRAVRQRRPYPVSIALGDDDTWTVLHAAIVLERAKAALRAPTGRAGGPNGPEPAAQSQPKALIPSAWRSLASAPKDRRILVSCTASAPYPVMIAMWDGESEKWVSIDKGTSGKTWSIRAWQPCPEPAPEFYCGFCGKASDEVKRLIAGPDVSICEECVELCLDIIGEAFVPGELAERMASRRAAQGTEAGTAETEGLGPKDDGPVAESDAPDPSSIPTNETGDPQ